MSFGRPQPAPSVLSELISRDVILTTMRGHLDVELAKRAARDFALLMPRTIEPTWLIDILDLTGHDASAVAVGGAWWASFRAGRGRRVLLVTRKASYRMVAATLGFGAHVPVKTFETFLDARNFLGIGGDRNSNTQFTSPVVSPGDVARKDVAS